MKDLETKTKAGVPLAQEIANFVIGLAADDIPAEVSERARLLMLDSWGIALASTQFDFAHRAHAAMVELGAGGSRAAIGFGTALQPRDATLLNGLLIHGLDYDDTHTAGVIHASAPVLSAAFTAALDVGASGEAMQTAYIAGMEVATRLGSVAKGGFHQVGFHPTGVVGVFGATVAVGKLRGLTAPQMAAAQGIALSMASGSLEFLADGAWTKRMHPGWAAQAALTAVALARQGFTGPKDVYEGRFGLYQAYLGAERAALADMSLATKGFGTVWEVTNVAVKPLPACHFTHAFADSAVAIFNAQNLLPEQIESVQALVAEETIKTVCEPRASKIKPQNGYDAQFSIPYAVACGLIFGRFGLAELDPDVFTSPEATGLAAKVSYDIDPNSRFPKYYSGEIIVKTTDGREFHHREDINRGSSDRPLSAEDITRKFEENTALAVSADRAAIIRDAILSLHTAPDLNRIERLLAGQAC